MRERGIGWRVDETDAAVGWNRPVINRVARRARASVLFHGLVHDHGGSPDVGADLKHAAPVEVSDQKIEHEAIFEGGRAFSAQALARKECNMPSPCGLGRRQLGKMCARI